MLRENVRRLPIDTSVSLRMRTETTGATTTSMFVYRRNSVGIGIIINRTDILFCLEVERFGFKTEWSHVE